MWYCRFNNLSKSTSYVQTGEGINILDIFRHCKWLVLTIGCFFKFSSYSNYFQQPVRHLAKQPVTQNATLIHNFSKMHRKMLKKDTVRIGMSNAHMNNVVIH